MVLYLCDATKGNKSLYTNFKNELLKMNIMKRVFLTILILFIVGFVFSGWFYRRIVTYKSVGMRAKFSITDNKLVNLINENIDTQTDLGIEKIIKIGLYITSNQLNFTTNKNDIDPNKLLHSKTAHCVGYASFFSTTCNYLIKKYNLADRWIVKHQVGQLYFLGANIHPCFNSSFFKNHDFVTIENIETGEVIAVDPSVNDYLFIDYVTYDK